MNKNDIRLIVIIVLIFLICMIIYIFIPKSENKVAKIYYDQELIKTIDLITAQNQEFAVDGYNGKVYIQIKDGKIKVKEEKSPLHLCSKQGYIDSPLETIVCLPNKIVIQIETDDQLDTIAR